jgi:uncharacterized membrane protein YphA (DoxX/SURF4 family)
MTKDNTKLNAIGGPSKKLTISLTTEYAMTEDNRKVSVIGEPKNLTISPTTIYKFKKLEQRIVEWMASNGLFFLRISLGIIYLWFGVVKFFPGLSPAELLATQTISHLSFGYIPSTVSLPILAMWECALGIGLILSRGMRVVLIFLFLQMLGTFLPLIFFPNETWKTLFVPTLEGQYIIKNIIIVSSGIVLGATLNGGRLIADSSK